MPLIKIANTEKNTIQPINGASENEHKIAAVNTAEIGLRSEKTDNNKYGWQIVDTIPYDKPCILYVGGDGTDSDRAANGNAKIIEQDILKPLNIKIPVYSVKYNLRQNSAGIARNLAFMKSRAEPLHDLKSRKQELTEDAKADDFEPRYLDKLYKTIIEPRISTADNKNKLPISEACRRMRMITFVAHCHGGYVMLELEKKMRSEMKRLGYSLEERKQILSQMLTVIHSPACALGVAKSQMISFMSIRDIEYPKRSNRLGNNFLNNYLFERYREHKIHLQAIQDGNEKLAAQYRALDIKPCYFAPQQGNLFLIQEKNQRTTDEIFLCDKNEHGDIGYGYAGKTPAGQMITCIASRIIKNSIQNSLHQQNNFVPLPPLEKLMLGESAKANTALKEIFPKMVENGKQLRQEIHRYALSKIKKDNFTR